VNEVILSEDAAKYIQEAAEALRKGDRKTLQRLRKHLRSEAVIVELRLRPGKAAKLRTKGLLILRKVLEAIDNELTEA
jgi:CTP-dependent riboflavin kinase